MSVLGFDGVPCTWAIKNGRTGLAGEVAQERDVESISAPEDVEPEVEVALRVHGPLAQQAEGVAGELDRVEGRQRRARS